MQINHILSDYWWWNCSKQLPWVWPLIIEWYKPRPSQVQLVACNLHRIFSCKDLQQWDKLTKSYIELFDVCAINKCNHIHSYTISLNEHLLTYCSYVWNDLQVTPYLERNRQRQAGAARGRESQKKEADRRALLLVIFSSYTYYGLSQIFETWTRYKH